MGNDPDYEPRLAMYFRQLLRYGLTNNCIIFVCRNKGAVAPFSFAR